MNEDKIVRAVLLVAILGGVLFRLVSLDGGDLWYDEGKQFWVAKGIPIHDMTMSTHPLMDTIRLNEPMNLEPPLMTVMLHYWSKAGDSIAWLRLLPCLLGIVAMSLMYGSALALGLRRAGALLVAALCSLSLPWVYYSLDLKAYSLNLACTSLVIFLTVRMLRDKHGGTVRYGALCAAVFAGCFSIYGFWLLLPFLYATIFLRILSDTRLRWRGKAGTLWFFAVIPLLAIAFALTHQQNHFQRGGSMIWYLPYLRPSWERGMGEFAARFVELLAGMISWQLSGMPVYIRTPRGVILAVLFLFFIVLVCHALVREWKNRNLPRLWVLSGFVYLMTVCSFLSIKGLFPLGPVRQNIFLSPFLILSFAICARCPAAATGATPDSWRGRVAGLVIAFLLISSLLSILRLRSVKFDRADVRGLVARIENASASSATPAYLYADLKTRYVFKHHYFFSAPSLRERIPPHRIRFGNLVIWVDRQNWPEEIEDAFRAAEKDSGGAFTQWYLLSGSNAYDYEQSLPDYGRIEEFLAGKEGVSGVEKIDTYAARALKVEYAAPPNHQFRYTVPAEVQSHGSSLPSAAF